MSADDVARLLAEAERWRRSPLGRGLTTAAAGHGALHWVGGVVRDGLRGCGGPDVDLLFAGDLAVFADRLRAAGAEDVRIRPAFRTMSLRLAGQPIDVAAPRRDRYPRPGDTPVIEPLADAAADLARRDFTVNAMLVDLTSAGAPVLIDPHDGLGDLRAGLLRPLGPQTLVEDPLRLLRGARYLERTGWRPTSDWDQPLAVAGDPQAWIHAAPGRLWLEHQRMADEPDPAAVVARLQQWGLDAAVWGNALPPQWMAWMRNWRRRLGSAPRYGGNWLTDLAGLARLAPRLVGGLPRRWSLHADQWPRFERLQSRLDRSGGDPLVEHIRRARGLL